MKMPGHYSLSPALNQGQPCPDWRLDFSEKREKAPYLHPAPSIGAIVQARLSSSRLPGKVLHPVAGRPLLVYLLESLSHCAHLADIVVATSTEPQDTPIARLCQELNIKCHRGPLADVAGRFKEVLDAYPFDAFVRVCGDSPLLDHRLIDRALEIFRGGDYDLVTNIFPRSFPSGQSVEVLRTAAFRRGCELMQEADDLEHVTRFFYRHPQGIKIHNFQAEENFGAISLAVDTPEDMERFAAMVAALTRPHWDYDVGSLVRLYREVTQRGS
jgi:spore coat polysaccharide biosynthesis protein SpsF (cytidylyltransferase family)